MTKNIKHFRLKIKTKTKSKMPAKINTDSNLFQTCMTFFILWNTTEDSLENACFFYFFYCSYNRYVYMH